MYDVEESASIMLKDENGKEKIYYKLSEFSINGKENEYILYTDYSKKEDVLNIYYGILEKNTIKPVTDEEDKITILKYIKKLDKDIANGMKF